MTQDKPKRIDQPASGSPNLYRRPERPKRSETKPPEILETATNETGEVFNPGDSIQVTSPWGEKAIAQIIGFYQDSEGNAWAHYTPSETRDGWTWEGGTMRAKLLVKANAS